VKEDDSGLSWRCATARERAEAQAGGRADPPPPFLETKNQLGPLPEMPRIFLFRLQCGSEGAPCGRGQGTASPPGWDAKSDCRYIATVLLWLLMLVAIHVLELRTVG
jgi:hypothetical protein